ncbi:MAG TPA: SUMF1/EgtB/PvdO family nonheme iron enzyme [Polyangiaceae bacterium]
MTSQPGRRFFLGIGVENAGGMFKALPQVPIDVRRIGDVFEHVLSYERVTLLADPSADELRAALNRWVVKAALGPQDRVVFYYSGHGHVDVSSHYLCTRGFRAEAVAEGIRASDLAALVLARDAHPGKMLLILDCCYASRAAGRTLLSHALERADCYLLAASAEGPAYDGVFSQAFVDVLGSPSPPSSLDELAAALKAQVGNRQSIRHLGVGGDRFDFLDKQAPGSLSSSAGAEAASAPAPHNGARAPILAAPTGMPKWASAGVSAPALQRRVIGFATFIALIGALGLWRLTRHSDERSPTPLAPSLSAQPASLPPSGSVQPPQTEQSPPDRIAIPGANVRFGIDGETARALYQECLRIPSEDCGSDFESSVFGRSAVASSPQSVRGFEIDTREASNQKFAGFLDSMTNLKPYPRDSGGVLLRDANGRALAVVAAEANEVSPYGIERAGQRIIAVPGRELRAANYLTWRAADSYCRAQGERLPTELEWELAARGSEERDYPWGNAVPDCRGMAFAGDVHGCPAQRTAPVNVASSPFDRSPLGVCDLGGNVLEWTASRFSSAFSADRQRCATTGCAIARGGSFLDRKVWLHSALRSRFNVVDVMDNLGFRCVKDLP